MGKKKDKRKKDKAERKAIAKAARKAHEKAEAKAAEAGRSATAEDVVGSLAPQVAEAIIARDEVLAQATSEGEDKAEAKQEDTPEPLGGFREALAVDRTVELDSLATDATPNFDGDKAAGRQALADFTDELSDLLERLYAESTAGSRRSVLLVIQGMDTSGKGGILKHVVSVNPEGVRATAFKKPTPEELSHDFLWRIEKALPRAGQLGVFDRSQYEDVLVVRVHELVKREVWMKRYAQINAFERRVVADGTTVIKVLMHLGRDEQKERLAERLARPDKHWKYNPGDLVEREHWDDYMQAYQAVIAKTSTVGAPWYVVPADRKWYARLAVQQLLLETLREMELSWPEADFDVQAEQVRLAES